jgi:iron complex transport system permease protein
MKVTVDIDKMLRENRITPAEYAKLKGSSAADTGSLAMNVLLGFGVIATAGGALALLQSAAGSVVLGAALIFGGITLGNQAPKAWGLLSSILLLVGALMTTGGILVLTEAKPAGFMAVTALLLVTGIWARSGLLISMATLALSPTIGAATAYTHATYSLVIEQPTVTVILFSLLAWGAYRMSLGMEPELQRLAIISSRTSLLLVNFGFWVGSLWGDSLGKGASRWESGPHGQAIPDTLFAIAWATALAATGVWAAREDRRWVVNLVSVFGAIHFYTQYFERLGASPGSIMAAGLGAIAISLALYRYNRTGPAQRPPATAAAR